MMSACLAGADTPEKLEKKPTESQPTTVATPHMPAADYGSGCGCDCGCDDCHKPGLMDRMRGMFSRKNDCCDCCEHAKPVHVQHVTCDCCDTCGKKSLWDRMRERFRKHDCCDTCACGDAYAAHPTPVIQQGKTGEKLGDPKESEKKKNDDKKNDDKKNEDKKNEDKKGNEMGRQMPMGAPAPEAVPVSGTDKERKNPF
jgi:hypothetical protein